MAAVVLQTLSVPSKLHLWRSEIVSPLVFMVQEVAVWDFKLKTQGFAVVKDRPVILPYYRQKQ